MPSSPPPKFWHWRLWFWRLVEGDLPRPTDDNSFEDELLVQSSRLRQRAGRLCLWAALGVGAAWTAVLFPHCLHLIKHPEWLDAKTAWLVVSAPPVLLVAALLGMAERFLTPAHILYASKRSPGEAADEFGKAMGVGTEAAKAGLDKLVESTIK